MKNKKVLAIALSLTLLMTAGCSSENSDKKETTEKTTTTTTTVSQENNQPPAEELDYMDRMKDIIVEIPPQGYDKKRDGVEYNKFKSNIYYSSTAERDTNVNVLLAPNYSEDKEYPVLYVLHGYYDNEDWMARSVVNLNVIYQNLLADGKAEEMIIVLPYIFCDKDMPYCTGMNEANNKAYDNFINDLTTDLMAFIESEFSVKKGRENTAITGFSMGGRESFFIGFKRPDLFGYIGSACTAPGLAGAFGCPLKEEEMKFDEANQPNVVFISSSKIDSVVGTSPDGYRSIMTKNGVKYLDHVMQSTGHDHSSVKPHLYNFLQMLFKE
ncbi:MAG: hypothetical protein IJ031_02050 [Oscillospiraceae bacterium]|nr:hypothetical protein [Oscillospiraceae bacterium]